MPDNLSDHIVGVKASMRPVRLPAGRGCAMLGWFARGLGRAAGPEDGDDAG